MLGRQQRHLLKHGGGQAREDTVKLPRLRLGAILCAVGWHGSCRLVASLQGSTWWGGGVGQQHVMQRRQRRQVGASCCQLPVEHIFAALISKTFPVTAESLACARGAAGQGAGRSGAPSAWRMLNYALSHSPATDGPQCERAGDLLLAAALGAALAGVLAACTPVEQMRPSLGIADGVTVLAQMPR